MNLTNLRRRGMALVMLLALTVGLFVPAWAAESKAQAPELSAWTPTDVQVRAVEGQEYAIAPKGTDPDWTKAAEPKEGFVTFEDLTPATAYVIYTRMKGETAEPQTKEHTTELSSIGVFSEDDYIPGAVVTAQPDPEDAQGLTYQWYYDAITTNEEGGQVHDLTPIDGATAITYTIQDADLGKYLALKVFKDEAEVASIEELGPVSEEGVPALPGQDDACPKDDTCPISRFTDAQADAWYHDGVHWALGNNVMNGVGNDKFAPGGTATRAMVVTMVWRLEGEPSASKAASFSDVSADAWYANAVAWASEVHAVNGTSDTTFSPDTPITREQLATILYRYAQAKGEGFVGSWYFLLDAPDADKISEYADEAMHWMVMNGIITGREGGMLAPQDNATRAEIATIFQRFCGTLGEAGLKPITPKPEAQEPAQEQNDLYMTLVNKTHKLPDNWESKLQLLEMKNAYGEDIRVEKGSYEAFQALREDLLKEGVDIELDSCYRSVERQQELWAEFEKEHGIDYCYQYVASPGFSEHHTGFAVDVCLKKDGKLIYDNDEMMKETAIWEKVHEKLPEYGFILRYLEGKEDITGYAYEPWHLRYVGDPEIAKAITEKGITLEEYLDQVEPADATVDYGTSKLYTKEDMDAAIAVIRAEFETWKGCELHSIRFAGDDANSADNIKWMNELKEAQKKDGPAYTQCIEFLSDFHSPKDEADLKDTAWEGDQEYKDWQWYLARTEGGDWTLLTWGY